MPQAWLVAAGVYTVDGDINDRALLDRLFGMCSFTHVLHLAAQVRFKPCCREHTSVHCKLYRPQQPRGRCGTSSAKSARAYTALSSTSIPEVVPAVNSPTPPDLGTTTSVSARIGVGHEVAPRPLL